jgi:hypothetical protein
MLPFDRFARIAPVKGECLRRAATDMGIVRGFLSGKTRDDLRRTEVFAFASAVNNCRYYTVVTCPSGQRLPKFIAKLLSWLQ